MLDRRSGLMAGAIAVLAVVAVAGWARKPGGSTHALSAQPAYYDQNGQAVYSSTAVNPAQPVSASEPCLPSNGPVNNNGYRSVGYQPAVYATPYPDDRYVSDRYVRSIHRPVRVVSRDFVSRDTISRDDGSRAYTERDVVSTHSGRSKTKSAVIVAGSAGTGAAIGAIAGGGKGAGIGALSGGAAGFIYDRLTHDHR